MKTLFSVLFCIVSLHFNLSANQDCEHVKYKIRYKISYIAPCDEKSSHFAASVLDYALALSNNRDNNLNVLVFINHMKFRNPVNRDGFLSISYGTLDGTDDAYIDSFYRSMEAQSRKQSGDVSISTFDSKKNPVDINLYMLDRSRQIGIKIYYDRYGRISDEDKVLLGTVVAWAANNTRIIKQKQVKDTIPYYANGWYLSMYRLRFGDMVFPVSSVNVYNEFCSIPKEENRWMLYLLFICVAAFLITILNLNSRKKSKAE